MWSFIEELVEMTRGSTEVITFIAGSCFTYFISRSISKESGRNNLTNEALKHFNSPEFMYVLQVLQIIKYEKWKTEEGKKIVYFFIPTVEEKERPSDDLMRNDLTVHQNLTLYIRFINQIYQHLKNRSVHKN